MNSREIFNHIFESFNKLDINYVILHSYQLLPERFDSDIDTAIEVKEIKEAISLLDEVLKGTGWRVIQYWRHENYAADCVISNDDEFLQVDFCTHYERNGRVVMPVEELVNERLSYKNFYVPSHQSEFVYILLKKILKKKLSDGSKEQLSNLLNAMNLEETKKLRGSLSRFLEQDQITYVLECISSNKYEDVDLKQLHQQLLKKTSGIASNLHYRIFDIKRKIDRIVHPTGLFVVLLGVDGAGKTTIADKLMMRYQTAFRKIDHYHSRVRVLKDISQIKSGAKPVDASDPHGKKHRAGKMVSVIKFGYYFFDFLIGNVLISKAKIKSTLVLIERYYYDYYIDKIRYNLNVSDAFLRFFDHFVKKPDIIIILTGDSEILEARKHEISREEIEQQKERFHVMFDGNPKASFIDTTTSSPDACVTQIIERCNRIMRERRKWN